MTTGIKRYNLALPEPMYADLKSLAETEHTTVLDLIRRFVKLGLLAVQIDKNPDAKIVIYKDGRER